MDHNGHVYEEINDRPITLRKGKRTCIEHSIHNFLSHGKLSPTHRAFVSSLDEVQVPRSIHEALRIPEWRKAVLEEVNALENVETKRRRVGGMNSLCIFP